MSTPTEAQAEEVFAIRSDIEWIEHPQRAKWVARDSITGSFFYFSEIEYAAAMLLDGQHDRKQILRQLLKRFPGNDFSEAWYASFVARLNSAHLLSPKSPRVTQLLCKSKRPNAKQAWLKSLLSPLAIRIPLFDPTPWLAGWVLPARIFFHPLATIFACIVGMLLLPIVLGKVLTADYRLSDILNNMQGDRWLLLLMCYIVVKSLHELGHALASARAGAACREIGLMFLFFTPCLYADTTDSWKLSSKWRRAGIALAGMYVELWLAGIAAIVWLSTNTGLVHSMATSVMIVCSIGTILVNANPFLRYDGYYILSDVWGVPNLTEQGREAVWSLFSSALTGRPLETSHLDANVWMLAVYAVLAAIYRTLLGIAIMLLAWTWLVPYGLGFIAANILVAYIFGLVFMMYRILRSSYREFLLAGTLKFTRVVIMFTLLIVAVVFVCEVPINTYVTARAVSDFADKTTLFAPQTGEVVSAILPGTHAQSGANIASMDSPEKRLELLVLQGQIAATQLKLKQLEERSALDDSVVFEIPATREVLAELQSKEKLVVSSIESLSIRAPYEGILLPIHHPLTKPITSPQDDRFNPSVLSVVNRGLTVERGTTIGWFTPQSQPVVTALVAQQDVKLLSIGMEVECRWDSAASETVTGTISRIAPDPVEETPTELLGDASLVSIRNLQGKLAPDIPHYQVTVTLAEDAPKHLKGSLATARIRIASRTLLASAIRYLQMSFKPVY